MCSLDPQTWTGHACGICGSGRHLASATLFWLGHPCGTQGSIYNLLLLFWLSIVWTILSGMRCHKDLEVLFKVWLFKAWQSLLRSRSLVHGSRRDPSGQIKNFKWNIEQ